MTHFSLKNKKYLLFSIVIYIGLWQIAALIVDNNIAFPTVSEVGKAIYNIIEIGRASCRERV